MTTERLFEFLVLSQTLSYSKTAKRLFMSQATLSRHIVEMEKELGATLLSRSTHSVRLTEAGRMLAGYAKPLIQKYEAALGRLRVVGLEVSGAVKIACVENVMYEQLLAFVRQFSEKFHEINCILHIVGKGDQEAALNDYDLLFSGFELQDLPLTITARVAFTDSGVLATLPYPHLMRDHRIGLEELAGETLLVPYADEMFCSYAANRQLADKLTGNRVNVVKMPNVESALMMTALGKGVAIIPQHIVHSAIGETLLIGITTPECVFDTYLYWNQARNNPAAKLLYEEFEAFSKSAAL